jgi:hypothetical protein
LVHKLEIYLLQIITWYCKVIIFFPFFYQELRQNIYFSEIAVKPTNTNTYSWSNISVVSLKKIPKIHYHTKYKIQRGSCWNLYRFYFKFIADLIASSKAHHLPLLFKQCSKIYKLINLFFFCFWRLSQTITNRINQLSNSIDNIQVCNIQINFKKTVHVIIFFSIHEFEDHDKLLCRRTDAIFFFSYS